MIQSLDIISVNIWSILISLVNLLLLFLILKKFLFKPVTKVMNERQNQVTAIYADAEKDRQAAADMKQEYETRMAAAREEADGLVRDAVQTAQRKSDSIIADANSQAAHLKQKAEMEIELEKKQMLSDVKTEISDLAVSIAARIMEREVSQQDHADFVEQFIENVGENK
ncbi:MAG: F0F1 ATP synthase subunit B [Clostridia bacterium]|nr:F0F1 ATP synthase subunit B [Clostridia bacterium]